MHSIRVNKDEQFLQRLNDNLTKETNIASWNLFSHYYTLKKGTLVNDFNEIRALSYLPNMTFLDYQIKTAQKVISTMNGRAILADEVGLGKTIEAGLILKEYMIRGLVKNALLLVPASLIDQWSKELREKFYISTATYRKNYRWDDYPIFITTLELAKRDPHRKELLEKPFDLILVDEAHKLKNRETQNFSFVRDLKKTYCLLLTATPIQNDVRELFNLVSILKPGYLGDFEQFNKKYRKNNQKTTVVYKPLKSLLQRVMIRNRREDTELDSVKRHVKTVTIQFSDIEQQTYDKLNNEFHSIPPLARTTFLRELCSSREACYLSLQKSNTVARNEKHGLLLEQIAALPHHPKASKLVEVIETVSPGKVLVFTEYYATQYYLQWYLKEHDISSVTFSGNMRRSQKDWVRQLFERDAQVLIATEAGGEGINLQFCNYIINYDLPWNPMRLEQRIGRVHRYGQINDIYIFNFIVKNTIEERIKQVLYDKLAIFQQVVGKVDKLLESLELDNLEKTYTTIIEQSSSLGEMEVKLNHLHAIIDSTGWLERSESNE